MFEGEHYFLIPAILPALLLKSIKILNGAFKDVLTNNLEFSPEFKQKRYRVIFQLMGAL